MNPQIKEDADCCAVWPVIVHRFDWKEYRDQPDMLTMPHIADKDRDGKGRWFVNFCPSCGKPARNRNILKERLSL